MKAIGDYIDQNPISSCFVLMYIIFFIWIAIEFYNAEPYVETISKAALENKLRIAHLHLKNANERKASKPMGNEAEIIAICQAQIKDFTNQLNEQSTRNGEQF